MLAYTMLPVAPLPNVDFPTIQVTRRTLPGASPEDDGIRRSRLRLNVGSVVSQESRRSRATSTLGTTNARVAVRPRIATSRVPRVTSRRPSTAAGGVLPRESAVRDRTYRKVNPADSPIMILSLTSQDNPARRRFSTPRITILAQKHFAGSLASGRSLSEGAQQPAVRVQVDPLSSSPGHGSFTIEDVRSRARRLATADSTQRRRSPERVKASNRSRPTTNCSTPSSPTQTSC